MEAKILFEDDDLLVLDKPSGMTVNVSDTTRGQETLQEWVEGYLHISGNRESESDFLNRAGVAHRLDKETSGVMLVAKTEAAFVELQRQFKERIVEKTYLALSHGKITPETGEIRVPVGRLPWNRKQFGVIADGKDAITNYKVLRHLLGKFGKKEEPFTLVELYPHTGRTHQIRVHLKYINHPIVSDFLYAGRKTARDDRKILERVFLHAHTISFLHPKTGEKVTFSSALPKELEAVIASCQ